MKYKLYKNIFNLTIFTIFILCLQNVNSDDFSVSEFLETLPNTPAEEKLIRRYTLQCKTPAAVILQRNADVASRHLGA